MISIVAYNSSLHMVIILFNLYFLLFIFTSIIFSFK